MGTAGVKISEEKKEKIKAKLLDFMLKNPGGTFGAACTHAKISFSEAYTWRKEDPQFEADVMTARDVADISGGDMAESRLMKAIKADNLTGIIFYLKTKHKARGYVERTETDHGMRPDSGDIHIKMNFGDDDDGDDADHVDGANPPPDDPTGA